MAQGKSPAVPLWDCVVPEKIQTSTTEGIGNSRGVGVGGGGWEGQRPRKMQRGRGLDNKITFRE